MLQSESIAKLVEALAKAQAKITAPPRNREVTVRPRNGGTPYKFEYTTLDALIEHVRGPLTQNGLWFTQTMQRGVDNSGFFLCTTLVHSSGEWIASEMPIYDSNGTNQEMGSLLTYRKRYALSAILGLASDMDDDANEADGNTVENVRDRSPAPKPPGRSPTPDAAKQAAIKFAQAVSKELLEISTEEELAVWRKDSAKLAKIDKLATYDKELRSMVLEALADAEARVLGVSATVEGE